MVPFLARDGATSRASPEVNCRGLPWASRVDWGRFSSHKLGVDSCLPLNRTVSPYQPPIRSTTWIWAPRSRAKPPVSFTFFPFRVMTHHSEQAGMGWSPVRQPLKRMCRPSELHTGDRASLKSAARRTETPSAKDRRNSCPEAVVASLSPIQ